MRVLDSYYRELHGDSSFLLLFSFFDYFGLKRDIHFHLQLYFPTFRNRKVKRCFTFGLFLLGLGGNGLLSSKCDFICLLFGIEKVTKDFRGSNAAAKAWLRGGFHSKECKRAPKQTTPPKTQKSSFCTIHKTVLRNRRATSARMGLVSKQMFWLIRFNPYAMSRYGLRKLYFGCKKVIFSSYFAVNRARFSAQLAVAR